MARQKRMLSEQKIYHVVMKGINAAEIFVSDGDFMSFLKYFKEACVDYDVSILAYCVLNNHSHFLLKLNEMNLSEMFKSFGAKYVPKYNAKHSRIGPLFNGRYYSAPINDDGYLLAVLRYIHYNPIKAGVCKSLSEYRWSSYNDYYAENAGITDTDFIKNIYSDTELKTLHIIDDNALDEFFILNSLIFGADDKELSEFLKRNENRNPESVIEIMRKAKISKLKIASQLGIDKRKI